MRRSKNDAWDTSSDGYGDLGHITAPAIRQRPKLASFLPGLAPRPMHHDLPLGDLAMVVDGRNLAKCFDLKHWKDTSPSELEPLPSASRKYKRFGCKRIVKGTFRHSSTKRILFSLVVATAVLTGFLLLSLYPCLYLCSIGSATDLYGDLLEPPQRTYEERLAFVVQSVRKGRKYLPLSQRLMVDPTVQYYDILNCPMQPPPGYPREYPILDVLQHWPLNDTDTLSDSTRYLHQGICVFNFAVHEPEKVHQQIKAYRNAEVPFVVKNDPEILKTVERWGTENYLLHKLHQKVYHGEFSKSLSMMYWKITSEHKVPENFSPPTEIRPTTFAAWYDRAKRMEASPQKMPPVHSNNTQSRDTAKEEDKSYLRLDGCESPTKRCDGAHRYFGTAGDGIYHFTRLDDADFLHDELPFLSPRYYNEGISKDYLVEPEKARVIQCRFGAKGLVAENHFDNERNVIAVLGGERRYLLGHPRNCKDMSLYPMYHPLERHSKVNWNAPNLAEFPNFHHVHINEVVLQAGDMLYLPTMWFHHIVSLDLNYQCNVRSGHSLEYDQDIYDCGFLYPWPAE